MYLNNFPMAAHLWMNLNKKFPYVIYNVCLLTKEKWFITIWNKSHTLQFQTKFLEIGHL